MKEGIHPKYVEATVVCACGNTFQTRSTKASIRLEICSNCHPFFTGRQKFVDSAGRVERFQKRFANASTSAPAKKTPAAKMAKGQSAALSKKKVKILSSAPIVIPKSTREKGTPKPSPAKATPPKAAH
jgi:large subunit ribosomal protein L31